jgi:hypothetical protein
MTMNAELYVAETVTTQRSLQLPAPQHRAMAEVIVLPTAGTAYDDEALAMVKEILTDPAALVQIATARQEIASGDVVRGVDEVRALRPRR